MNFTFEEDKDVTQEDQKSLAKYTFVEDQPEEPEKVWDSEYLSRNISTVRDTMKAIRGTVVNDWDDQEVQDKYLETMRAFDSGNSVATLRFLQGMVGADDEQLKTIGEGIRLFDEMPGAFSEGSSFSDKAQAVGDYAQSIILDPANLLGLGVGKLAVGAGSKTIGTAAKMAGVRAMKAGGQKAADAAFKKAVAEAGKKTVEGIAQRTAKTQATKGLAKLGTREALKEAGVVIATDTALAGSIEYARQVVRRDTGVQEGVELAPTALAALGTMILGGASYSSNLFRGTSGWSPTVRALNDEADAGNVLQAIIKNVDATDSWAEKVARGTELEDLDGEYWIDLIETMLPAMEREGYVWVRRDADDKVSNWLADVLKTAEPEDARIFAREWSEKTGIALPSLDEKGLEFFADTFAFKMNQSARIMNRTSQVAKRLGKDVDSVTFGDILSDIADPTEPQMFSRLGSKLPAAAKYTVEKVQRIQNNVIRLIVSNLSTTRLNLVGYGASTALNSMSDVSQAILYSGGSHVARVLGKQTAADRAIKTARVLKDMQWQKAKNLLDPNTTLDQFLAYTQMRPKQLKELTSVLQGGIDDPNAVAKNFGVTPNDTVLGAGLEKGVDFIQRMNFVQAQDIYTKSQEFLYHMDKKLRIAFDRPMADMLADPDLRRLMADPRWAKAEADAVYETQRAIYSQTFRRSGAELGRAAAFIEDFRNIPGIGLLIPFGRFFNNVIATTMDMSGLSIMTKALGYNPNRSFGDLAARAAVSWTFVSMMAEKEREYIDKGLNPFESENSRGEIEDNRYTYPLSLYKGVARLVAYHRQGEEPPQDLVDELKLHFNQLNTIKDFLTGEGEIPENIVGIVGQYAVGQLTRDLTEASNEMLEFAGKLLEGDATIKESLKVMSSPLTSAVSGATRFAEPLSVMRDVIRGADMRVLDPKDGSEIFNTAFRYLSSFDAFTTSDVVKYDAASGKRSPQLDKYFADRASKMTDTERVLNLVGINPWTLNESTDSATANNMFVKYFHSFLEMEASKLMANKKFREGSLETRKVMWSDIKEKARKNTKSWMELKAGEEPRLLLIVEIHNSGKSQKEIRQAMEAISPDMTMDEMNMEQLKTLKAYLDHREEWLRLRNR